MLFAKSRKAPWRLDSGKIAPSLMWCIDDPERATKNSALCVIVAVMDTGG